MAVALNAERNCVNGFRALAGAATRCELSRSSTMRSCCVRSVTSVVTTWGICSTRSTRPTRSAIAHQ